MNTIHDLRGTLAAHAEIHDVEIGTRSSAIARRVRVVRRRRVAGVGAAAALAVAATAGVVLPHTGSGPAPATRLLGVAVPTTLTADGYLYDYASSATADAGRPASVTVDPEDGPIVVSWATEGADQSVEVSTPYTDFTSTEDDFTDYVLVPDGAGLTKVEVAGSGRTALAIYHLDATPPAGVTTDGITFRQEVPGRELVAAKIGAQGADRLSLDVTVPADGSPMMFTELCTASAGAMSGHAAWLTVSIDGQPQEGTGCSAGTTFDPGSFLSGPDSHYRPGQHLRVDLRLLDRPHGQLLNDSTARIGYAAYALTTPDRTFPGGLRLSTVTEEDGHTWRLVKSASGLTRGARPWSVTAPASTQRLLIRYAVNGGSGTVTVQPMIDGQDTDGALKVGRGVGRVWNSSAGTVDAGHHTFSMRIRGSGEARTAVGFYELVD